MKNIQHNQKEFALRNSKGFTYTLISKLLHSKSKSNTSHIQKLKLVSGFTLIEALLAIFIFSVALVSLITITARGIVGTAQARDQVTAQFLAQEGVEIVRNVRDTNLISGAPWLQGIDGCTISDPCYIAYSGSGDMLQSGNSIGLEALSGQYEYEPTNSPDADFFREIYYEPINSAEGRVTAVVSWINGDIPRSITLSTLITEWTQ